MKDGNLDCEGEERKGRNECGFFLNPLLPNPRMHIAVKDLKLLINAKMRVCRHS